MWSIKESDNISRPAVQLCFTFVPPLRSFWQAAGVWTWCLCPRWWPARGTWPWPRSSAALWPPCCWPCWSCVSSTARDSCWRRSPVVSHNICTHSHFKCISKKKNGLKLGSHFNTGDIFHAPLPLLSMGCMWLRAASIELEPPSPGASMHTQRFSSTICSLVKISKMEEKVTLNHILQNVFSYQKDQTKKINTVISYPKCVIRLCVLRCSEQAVQNWTFNVSVLCKS